MNNKNKDVRDLFVIDFVQFVSSPQTHAKRVRKIRKAIQTCPSNLSELQWLKMWRGFYYAIWYTEMRKGGEELIEEMGGYSNADYLLSGFKSLSESWQGIDAFRIDKYMFCVRIMLRNIIEKQIQSLMQNSVLFEGNSFLKRRNVPKGSSNETDKEILLLKQEQKIDNVVCINSNVIDYILSVSNSSVGLFMHICDIYIEELKKFLTEDLSSNVKCDIIHDMLVPFGKRLALIRDERLHKSIKKVFDEFLELITAESITFRIDILKKLSNTLIEIASQIESVKNRVLVYSIGDTFKEKLNLLSSKSKDQPKLKRKIIGFDRRNKRVKYQLTSSTPYARSIVPLPVI